MNKTSVKAKKNPELHSPGLGTESKRAVLLAPHAALLVLGVSHPQEGHTMSLAPLGGAVGLRG